MNRIIVGTILSAACLVYSTPASACTVVAGWVDATNRVASRWKVPAAGPLVLRYENVKSEFFELQPFPLERGVEVTDRTGAVVPGTVEHVGDDQFFRIEWRPDSPMSEDLEPYHASAPFASADFRLTTPPDGPVPTPAGSFRGARVERVGLGEASCCPEADCQDCSTCELCWFPSYAYPVTAQLYGWNFSESWPTGWLSARWYDAAGEVRPLTRYDRIEFPEGTETYCVELENYDDIRDLASPRTTVCLEQTEFEPPDRESEYEGMEDCLPGTAPWELAGTTNNATTGGSRESNNATGGGEANNGTTGDTGEGGCSTVSASPHSFPGLLVLAFIARRRRRR